MFYINEKPLHLRLLLKITLRIMAKNKKETTDNNVESLESALTRTEQYIEKNQKMLTIVALVIVVIVGSFIGYKRLYIAPMEKEAQALIFPAENYFERDSFNLVLNGDGNNPGVLEIIDNFGPTRTANLAHYYAGISYRQLGNYEDALTHLKKFSTSERMIGSIALGAIGDCYVELEKLEEAANYYVEAAKKGDNEFSTPMYLMKAALVYEELSKFNEALNIYKEVKNKFPKSTEARDIEKHITSVELRK